MPNMAVVYTRLNPPSSRQYPFLFPLIILFAFLLFAEVYFPNSVSDLVAFDKKTHFLRTYGKETKFTPIVDCQTIKSSCDKWIVVTSISSPTDDVKRLASFPDWNLVVVADEKTPTNWSLPGVHLLSVAYQKSLGFSFVQQLPFFSYTRKAVGYLYAIQQGAKFIYDTDDDNKPFGQGLDLFDYSQSVSGLRFVSSSSEDDDARHHTFNPYRFFGQPSIWPRGFPLEWISGHNNGNESMEVCRKMKTSAVQQGLVHKDPDVDAIYRLMKADAQDGLNEHFNAFAPPISLSKGTFAPWNSQNTLFSYPAFFTMFLPTTVSFRTTDIWRSFFAQKLLHLVDETVAFYPPNAVQFRNSHSFLKDFVSEKEVYYESGAIIEFLHEWKCQEKTIIECTLKLADEFRDRKFFGDDDVTLIGLWIDTLQQIGYDFPLLDNCTSTDDGDISMDTNEELRCILDKQNLSCPVTNCRRANLDFSIAQTTDSEKEIRENIDEKIKYFEDIVDWCLLEKEEDEDEMSKLSKTMPLSSYLADNHASREELNDKMNSVAIITNNWPWLHSIEVLQRMYAPFFAVTVFCGTWKEENYQKDEDMDMIKPFNFIHLTEKEMTKGFYHYYCMAKTRDLRLQNIKGYYLFSDDVVFNIWNKNNMDIVFSPLPIHKTAGVWWNWRVGKGAATRAAELLEGKYKDDEQIQKSWKQYGEGLKKYGLKEYGLIHANKSAIEHLTKYSWRVIADFQYIPKNLMDYVSDMYEVFFEAGLFLELSFNKILYTVPYETKPSKYLWSGERGHWPSIYNDSLMMIHPIKLSRTAGEGGRTKFCNNIVAAFQQNLFT